MREKSLTLFPSKHVGCTELGLCAWDCCWFTSQCVHTHMASACNWHVNCDTTFCTTESGRPFLKVKMGGVGYLKSLMPQLPKIMKENNAYHVDNLFGFVWSMEQLNTMKCAVAWKLNVQKLCRLVGKELSLKLNYLYVYRIERSVSDLQSFNLKWPCVILTFQVQIRWYGITNF